MKKLMFLLAMILTVGSLFAQKWEVNPIEDLLTGNVRTVLTLDAETSEGTLRDAWLGIIVDKGEVEVVVFWGGYGMDTSKSQMIRFGSAPAQVWGLDGWSASKESLFPGDVKGFLAKLKAMAPTDALIIQATRATGSKSVARWYIGNLAEVAPKHVPGW